MPVKARPLLDRLLARVVQSPTGCWLLTGHRMKNGYARTSVSTHGGPRSLLAHRVAYALFIGSIPEGMTIDHLCCVKHCINPTQLEPVLNRENSGRYWRTVLTFGCGHPRTPENRRYDGLGCLICARALKRRRYWERKGQMAS